MGNTISKNLQDIAESYGKRVEEHGTTAVAAGWRDSETQNLRFEQLYHIIDQASDAYSLADLGCGYGAIIEAMPDDVRSKLKAYHGYDISDKMITAAEEKFKDQDGFKFFNTSEIQEKTDYVIASGIFNHHFDAEPKAWQEHITKTIQHMYEHAEKGIAFNAMTTYVDYQEDYIHYCDPSEMLKTCMDLFGRHVTLIHDYGLFEFTVLVRKG